MVKKILGKVASVYKGEYDATKEYVALDRVHADGILYECLVDAPMGTALSDTYYWKKLFSNGSDGVKGESGAKGPVPSHIWKDKTLYWADDTTGTNLQGPQGLQGEKGDSGNIITLSTDPASDASEINPASSYSIKLICDKVDESISSGISDEIDSTSSTTIASSKAVKDALASVSTSTIPAGFICAFYGTFSGRNPIPIGSTKPDTGWVICDGTNTPDLRDRFLRVAYKTDAHMTGRGVAGGSTSHTHTITVNDTTLTTDQISSHSHAYSSRNSDNESFNSTYVNGGYFRYNTSTDSTGGGTTHTHTVSTVSTVSNDPAYMILAYIMKL